ERQHVRHVANLDHLGWRRRRWWLIPRCRRRAAAAQYHDRRLFDRPGGKGSRWADEDSRDKEQGQQAHGSLDTGDLAVRRGGNLALPGVGRTYRRPKRNHEVMRKRARRWSKLAAGWGTLLPGCNAYN